MSLRQRQEGIIRLGFDPSITAIQAGDESRFEWAIDHESQVSGDWCWAACLKNALSCFGFYVGQDEIVDRFQTDQGDSPEAVSDDRIPTPEHVRNLWRSYGFYRADWLDRPISFKTLTKELTSKGPVQIELWREGAEGERHLVLMTGVRKTAAGFEVCVSDPFDLEPEWHLYDKMRGPNPLPSSNFGEWRRTYVGLEYEKGYLRRFFGRPSRYLADLEPEVGLNPDGGPVPQVTSVASPLQFETPPDPAPLSYELAIASYGYRHFRYRTAAPEKRESRKADMAGRLFLFESIPVWRPPFEIDSRQSLSNQLSFFCWHHQIHNATGPRYYAHSWYFEKLRKRFDRGWRTSWFGERWMAERVDQAIQKLDSDFAGHEAEEGEEVWMVWFRRYGLVTLLLTKSKRHMVVSARREREKTLPLLSLISDDRLQANLAEL